MAPNPPRATAAGRAFNDLRNLAKRSGRPTDELLVLYVLERFLFRVSLSPFADRLVLKGGLLLTVLDARRATRDADLLAMHLDGGEHHVRTWVGEIASIEVEDGVTFDSEHARSAPTREGAAYGGVRVTIPSSVGKARVNLALDVNFGDPVTPGPMPTQFPQMLGGPPFPLLGYPVETVLAEKLTTALELGDLNTRDRDWADVWHLTGAHNLDGNTMVRALRRTCAHRAVPVRALSEAVLKIPEIRQGAYAAWRRRQAATELMYPASMAEVVQAVLAFADPPLLGSAADLTWDAADREWR
ncbi:nucleotidyl transferase AbiEii/AbiGii toxin family protein [Frankia sp. CiP3]|uniref:nucleotidyl transferase AbiEii/AbiGii toxin family protein n=1 Tax=Frankia sp. CiP3 TaxID=2880971 RepID=UPI001EF5130E|nr:nucleotidyl transferase AbiEii/AbiGii toxin family protein [Frankia sp. CiP3]